jgi:type I restriction enzyme R subunit
MAKTAQGEGTFKIFGADDERGYLDKYSIASRSRRDDAADPHTMAPSEMTSPPSSSTRSSSSSPSGRRYGHRRAQRVLERAVGLRTFLRPTTGRQSRGFIAKHFKENVEPLGSRRSSSA